MSEFSAEAPITVMFTDVVASTELANRLGDEAAREVIRSRHDLVEAEVSRHGGRIVKSLGDGYMAAFASARKGVVCAAAIILAEQALVRRTPGDEARIKIGLNVGEALEESGDLVGGTVNVAARIVERAEGGEALASDVLRQIVGTLPEATFAEKTRVRLKGFEERFRLFRVVPAAPEPSSPEPQRTALVGREEELAQLLSVLEATARGQGGLVTIGGESGIGKTRLTEEVLSEARRRGFLALVGRCYEMEGAPPYIPFLEMTETTARIASPEIFREVLGDDAPGAARVMPELRKIFPDIPPAPDLPVEQERRYIFNCFRGYLARSSRIQPLLLVFEDLQWADESTLLLIEHLAETMGEVAILGIGTYRDIELDVSRPLAKTLERLVRGRLARRISLKRLSEHSVAEMLLGLAGSEAPPALVKAVYAETEGNPFFVEEVFAHLNEEGKLFDESGSWREDLELDELDVPEGVRLVIGRRLERLGVEAMRLLQSAAVIGRAFDYELLERLVETDPRTLLDAVDEAERSRLVTTSQRTGGKVRFTFSHELIRQTLLAGLSIPRLQDLHLRIAKAMEAAYAGDLQAHAADIAHHLYQAGAAADGQKTAEYLVIAGDQALEAVAYEEAFRSYELGHACCPADTPLEAELLIKIGHTHRRLGQWEESLASWELGLAAYERLGDPESVARACRRIVYEMAWSGLNYEAVAFARRGLSALGDQRTLDRGRLLASNAAALTVVGLVDEAASAVEEALSIADEFEDDSLRAEAMGSRLLILWATMSVREASSLGGVIAETLRSRGIAGGPLASALSFQAQALMLSGQTNDAQRVASDLAEVARRAAHPGGLLTANRIDLGSRATATGDFELFDTLVESDRERAEALGPFWHKQAMIWKGLVTFWRGDWDEAMTLLTEAAEGESGVYKGFSASMLTVVYALAGRHEEVLDLVDRHLSEVRPAGSLRSMGEWMMLTSGAEALWLIGENARAGALYPLIVELKDLGTVGRYWDWRTVETCAGAAAAAAGDWPSAENHFEAAIRQAEEIPLRIEQATTRHYFGRALLQRGGEHAARGKSLVNAAAAVYRELRMPRHEAAALALLKP